MPLVNCYFRKRLKLPLRDEALFKSTYDTLIDVRSVFGLMFSKKAAALLDLKNEQLTLTIPIGGKRLDGDPFISLLSLAAKHWLLLTMFVCMS